MMEEMVLRGYKLDDNGRHPWKSEANKNDNVVLHSVITGMYAEVYKPSFSTTFVSMAHI